MKLKYALFTTFFFATTLLLAAEAMDVLTPTSTSGSLIVVPQESSKEWTRDEKLTMFEQIEDQLKRFSLKLNKQQIVDEELLDFEGRLRWSSPYIQDQILREFCKFKWLKVLILSRNQLTALPPQIGDLIQLTSLSLDNNQLRTLPASIRHIATLTFLNLPDNPLLPIGNTPEEWGRQELKACFGNRMLRYDLSLDERVEALQQSISAQNLRIKRIAADSSQVQNALTPFYEDYAVACTIDRYRLCLHILMVLLTFIIHD